MIRDMELCQEICEMLKAMGHPVRVKILCYLMENEKYNVNRLSELLGIPQSTTSQHIGILRNKNILSSSKSGVDTYYYIKDLKVIKIMKIFKELKE